MNKKSLAYPVIFMTVVAAVFTLILAILNVTTLERVKANEELDLQRKILYVFDLYDENTSDEEVVKIFNEKIVEEKNSNGEIYYVLNENGQVSAYAVPFHGPGLWGSINGYIGLNKDFHSITGIEFIKQSETPGLGGRISESPYKEQYRGVEIPDSSDKYIVNRPAPGGNVDAIAGATQTSTFVQDMINKGLVEFIKEVK